MLHCAVQMYLNTTAEHANVGLLRSAIFDCLTCRGEQVLLVKGAVMFLVTLCLLRPETVVISRLIERVANNACTLIVHSNGSWRCCLVVQLVRGARRLLP